MRLIKTKKSALTDTFLYTGVIRSLDFVSLYTYQEQTVSKAQRLKNRTYKIELFVTIGVRTTNPTLIPVPSQFPE
jgi:hypothetical protein